jgi:molecular chaperone HscC
VLGTHEKHALVIERKPGTLDKQQIEQAREQMRHLKFHPRDALPNRTALARADALHAELVGEARQELAAAIAALHGALETQDSALISPARERLVSLIAALTRR